MKAGIHPEYKSAKITCACGRITETRTTVGEIHVEICSHCHPFFTGRQKLVDTAGRVERFKAKYGDAATKRASAPAAGEAPVEEAVEESPVAEEPVAEAEPAAAEAEADVTVAEADASDGEAPEPADDAGTTDDEEETPA